MLGNHLLVSSGRFIPIAALEVLYTKKEMIKKKTEKKKRLGHSTQKAFCKTRNYNGSLYMWCKRLILSF